MKLYKNYTGQIINGIKCINFHHKDSKSRAIYTWQCPCCINTFESEIGHIKDGSTKSCGCFKHVLNIMCHPIEIGTQYGDLIVISNSNKSYHGDYYSKCICLNCNKKTEIRNSRLKGGYATQCNICRIKSKISKSENLFFNTLEKDYTIKIERQFPLENFLYDGKIGNTLIECDGDYWHRNTGIRDLKKHMTALKHGYQLLRFELNGVKEVEKVIQQNKFQLDTLLKEQ